MEWQRHVQSILLLQLLFLGRSELPGSREKELVALLRQGRLATGTHLSSALSQYIPGKSKGLSVQTCFDATKKGRET